MAWLVLMTDGTGYIEESEEVGDINGDGWTKLILDTHTLIEIIMAGKNKEKVVGIPISHFPKGNKNIKVMVKANFKTNEFGYETDILDVNLY
jgi:hypothetical protein